MIGNHGCAKTHVANKVAEALGRKFLVYNCHRNSSSIRFIPELSRRESVRTLARQIAGQWGADRGRYCFNTDIPTLARMIEHHRFRISFPTLNYMHPRERQQSRAQIAQSELQRYTVGKYLTARHTAEAIKSVLGAHGVSMTGRKEQLLEKLANLSAKVYEEHESELDHYFSKHRFIRISAGRTSPGQEFPVLDDLDLRNMLLTMYIVKHLRGNTILEAGYENDTFDLVSLARALLKQEITLTGSFLRVE